MSPLIALVALLTLGIASALTAPQSARPPECLRYQPAKVAIRGRVTARVFAGPPDYESVARGDQPESLFVLRADHPVCVDLDPARTDPEVDAQAEQGSRELQLDLVHICSCATGLAGRAVQFYAPAECSRKIPALRKLAGATLTVHGVLRHSIVGHDHTRLLIVVDSLPGIRASCNERRG